MRSPIFPSIPLDTAKAALEVYGRRNAYIFIGDQAEELMDGIFFRDSTTQIQDYRLAIFYLSTIFQHYESLPDQQAIDALRVRLDWKYALHASLHPIPMETSLLCEFRRLVSSDLGVRQNFQTLLDRLAKIPQSAFNDCFTQDADQIIHHICTISRVAKVWETINNALEALAIRNPNWLRTCSLPYWYERYGHSRKDLNLRADLPELETLAQTVGSDGFYLLQAVAGSEAKDLAGIPEIVLLRKNWAGQFEGDVEDVIWKKDSCAGCFFTSRARAAS
jgi:transposase